MVEQSEEDTSSIAVSAIIANCKRLIADAELLIGRGSHGSAMSLAILAFEEAGKGHREELGWTKTKRTPSWHQFRQIVASVVLLRAVLEKYKINLGKIPEQVATELRARLESAKTVSDIFRQPLPDELRNVLAEAQKPALEHLSGDQAAIAELELRYVRLIAESAAKGEIEETRQRGMYVDVTESKVTSDPAEVGLHEVYRWIFAAKRTLLLLETGDYSAPFSPLAARLEDRLGALPETDSQVLELYREVIRRVLAGEEFADVYFSTLPSDEQKAYADVLPTLRTFIKDKLPPPFGRS